MATKPRCQRCDWHCRYYECPKCEGEVAAHDDSYRVLERCPECQTWLRFEPDADGDSEGWTDCSAFHETTPAEEIESLQSTVVWQAERGVNFAWAVERLFAMEALS